METPASSESGLVTGLKVVSAVVAVGVVIQAWLGSTGFFQGEPGRIDLHEMFANLFFLLVVAQVVLVVMLQRKGQASQNLLIMSVVTVAFTVAQIGLGYGTRDSVDALAWHLPVGVTLMGVSAVCMAMVWNLSGASRQG